MGCSKTFCEVEEAGAVMEEQQVRMDEIHVLRFFVYFRSITEKAIVMVWRYPRECLDGLITKIFNRHYWVTYNIKYIKLLYY